MSNKRDPNYVVWGHSVESQIGLAIAHHRRLSALSPTWDIVSQCLRQLIGRSALFA